MLAEAPSCSVCIEIGLELGIAASRWSLTVEGASALNTKGALTNRSFSTRSRVWFLLPSFIPFWTTSLSDNFLSNDAACACVCKEHAFQWNKNVSRTWMVNTCTFTDTSQPFSTGRPLLLLVYPGTIRTWEAIPWCWIASALWASSSGSHIS